MVSGCRPLVTSRPIVVCSECCVIIQYHARALLRCCHLPFRWPRPKQRTLGVTAQGRRMLARPQQRIPYSSDAQLSPLGAACVGKSAGVFQSRLSCTS
jgi:hypothetical protein